MLTNGPQDEQRRPLSFDLASGQHETFNPLAFDDCEAISGLLHKICTEGLNHVETAELDDQIEALVPALIELRDAGHLKLNFATVASHATLDGFMGLADDARLTPLSRAQCTAIRNRMLVLAVKARLGHL